MRAISSPWACATRRVLVPRSSTPLPWFGKRAVGARIPSQIRPIPYRPTSVQILAPDILQIGVEAIPSLGILKSRVLSRPARPRQPQLAPPSKPPRQRPSLRPSPRLSPRLRYVSSLFLLILPYTLQCPGVPLSRRYKIFP